MIFTKAKLLIAGGVVAIALIFGGVIWWQNGKIDTLEQNNVKLENSIETQKEVIEQQKQDAKAYRSIISRTNKEKEILSGELEDLRNRFDKIGSDGKVRDIGVLAKSKTKLVEKVINNAIVNANRCYEIAMGAELTEDEKNAEKRSQINPECPSIANPNYDGS